MVCYKDRGAEREAWSRVAKPSETRHVPLLRLCTNPSHSYPSLVLTLAVAVVSADALTGAERRAEPGVFPEQWWLSQATQGRGTTGAGPPEELSSQAAGARADRPQIPPRVALSSEMPCGTLSLPCSKCSVTVN